jgi:hypothetical protein
VHLLHTDPLFTSPATSSIVRDHLLNRILDNALRGLRVNAIRLVVEDGTDIAEYAIEVDIDNFIARGNPYEPGQVSASGGRLRESISIRSKSIIAGRTRVHTAHAVPTPLSADLTAALT